MQVFPYRPIFPADFFEECADLVCNGSATRSDHFCDEQAGEDAVLLRDVAANGEAGAFFAAEGDLIFADVLADVLESYRSLQGGLAVGSCSCVEELGGGDAARGRKVPAASFDEIVVDKGENVVGLNPGT